MSFANRLLALAILTASLTPCASAQKPRPIGKGELAKWINAHSDCTSDGPPPYFYRFDEVDLKGDQSPQVMVVASTCMTGTAGPDVHSVFSRNSDGEIVELPIAEPKDPKVYDNLFGNRNYDLTVEGGFLVATFRDDAHRDTPLTIKYKWNGREFGVVSMQKTGVFLTSYDCSKAQSEVEQAICHVESLAALDRALGAVYKTLLAQLSAPDRESLRSEQRAWLSERDKECAPYKGWVACLSDLYQTRIEKLKKRSSTPAQKP